MASVLITGAGRGLGLELARQYAQDGWSVIGTVRNAAGAGELAKLGARAITLDVADASQVKALSSQLAGTPIDVLLCIAGIVGKRGAARGR